MPNTGERREIKRYTTAKEIETVVESKKLVSKTKQRSAKVANEKLYREWRNAHVPNVSLTDAEASDRMVDEGDPNAKPIVGQLQLPRNPTTVCARCSQVNIYSSSPLPQLLSAQKGWSHIGLSTP